MLKYDSDTYYELLVEWFWLFSPSSRPLGGQKGLTRQQFGLDSTTHAPCSETQQITDSNPRECVGLFCQGNSLLPSHFQKSVAGFVNNLRPP